MNTITRLIALGLLLTAASTVWARAADGEVSEMPVMRIFSDVLKITFLADHNGIVATAEVSAVTPNSAASKRDIELLDELIAIDHRPIKGMRYEDAIVLIDRELKPGEKRTFTFQGRRGFFNQRSIKYEFVVVGKT